MAELEKLITVEQADHTGRRFSSFTDGLSVFGGGATAEAARADAALGIRENLKEHLLRSGTHEDEADKVLLFKSPVCSWDARAGVFVVFDREPAESWCFVADPNNQAQFFSALTILHAIDRMKFLDEISNLNLEGVFSDPNLLRLIQNMTAPEQIDRSPDLEEINFHRCRLLHIPSVNEFEKFNPPQKLEFLGRCEDEKLIVMHQIREIAAAKLA